MTQPLRPITKEQAVKLLERWYDEGAWGDLTFHFEGGRLDTVRENRTWKAEHLQPKAS